MYHSSVRSCVKKNPAICTLSCCFIHKIILFVNRDQEKNTHGSVFIYYLLLLLLFIIIITCIVFVKFIIIIIIINISDFIFHYLSCLLILIFLIVVWQKHLKEEDIDQQIYTPLIRYKVQIYFLEQTPKSGNIFLENNKKYLSFIV